MITKALAYLLALAVIFGGVQSWRIVALKASIDEARATAAETALLKGRALQLAGERNDRETTNRLRAAASAAASARADLDGLRNAAAAVAADPEPAGCADDGRLGRVLGLLAESAGLVEEGSERVGRLAEEKAGLQRHHAEVGAVLVTP